jgi:hypothetical protein
MNNAQIIFAAAQELAEAGKIKYTGKTFKAVNAAGEEVEVKETEAIHTYAEWKSLGQQVQKGQNAIAKFTIWMFTDKPSKAALAAAAAAGKEEADADPHYYMKEAAFFSASQVAPATAK